MAFSFKIESEVTAKKNRLRVTRNGAFTDPRVKKNTEDLMKLVISEQNKTTFLFPIEGAVKVTMKFYVKKRYTVKDVDGMATTMLDVLQKAEVIVDDKYVTKLHVEKHRADSDYTLIVVERDEEGRDTFNK